MNSLFFIFSTGAWVSAALVLRSKNPVHSVFYLVLTFLHASGLLLLLGLEFFALLQLLVYIGALAIMFLFVVMLLDIPATEIVAHQRGTYPVAALLFLTLLMAVAGVLWQPMDNSPFVTPLWPILSPGATLDPVETSWQVAAASQSPLAQLGVALYGVHVDLLLIASLLLLVAMMGAVALTLKRRVHAPLHDVFVQHSVDFQKVVSKIQGSKLGKAHNPPIFMGFFFYFNGNFFSFFAWKPVGATPSFRGPESLGFLSNPF